MIIRQPPITAITGQVGGTHAVKPMKGITLWGFIVLLLSLVLAGLLTDFDGRLSLLFVFITVSILFFSGIWIWQSFRDLRRSDHKFITLLLKVIGVLMGLVVYIYFTTWLLSPDLLPQHNYYDLIGLLLSGLISVSP